MHHSIVVFCTRSRLKLVLLKSISKLAFSLRFCSELLEKLHFDCGFIMVLRLCFCAAPGGPWCPLGGPWRVLVGPHGFWKICRFEFVQNDRFVLAVWWTSGAPWGPSWAPGCSLSLSCGSLLLAWGALGCHLGSSGGLSELPGGPRRALAGPGGLRLICHLNVFKTSGLL